MSTIYVIDSCSLIDAAHQYNMSKKTFAHIWGVFTELIEDEKLISSYEVKDELKDKDLVEWAKDNKTLFYPLTKEMLAVLWKFDLLCDDTEGLIQMPEFTTDNRLKGAHYYFCRNDLSRFRRVITNIGLGFYRPPRLRCR